jgi:hypothetical protein
MIIMKGQPFTVIVLAGNIDIERNVMSGWQNGLSTLLDVRFSHCLTVLLANSTAVQRIKCTIMEWNIWE